MNSECHRSLHNAARGSGKRYFSRYRLSHNFFVYIEKSLKKHGQFSKIVGDGYCF